MRQILAKVLVAIVLSVVPAGVISEAAYAACPTSNTAKGQVLNGIGQTGADCDSSGVGKTAGNIVEILSYIAGIAAIIVIVIAGFKYITSNGDSGKISSAKNTLIYAMVGLAVAALARVIVNFIIGQTG